MLPQNAAEEQEKCKSVNDSTGSDVPSRFPDQKSKRSATNPNRKEDVGSYVPIEVEQAPRQEQQRQRVGQQVPPTAMHKRMGEDAEHPLCSIGYMPSFLKSQPIPTSRNFSR